MDQSLPGTSVQGILQARVLEWVAMPFSKGLSGPRNQICISFVSRTGRRVVYHQCHLGSASAQSVSLTVQAFSRVQLFAIPWTTARHTSLSITNPRSLLKLMSESVMPSNHLILCRPLLLLPPIPPSIRVFPSESVLPIRWPKYWSFSFSISPSYENSVPISFRMDWLDLLAVSRVFSNTTVQKHQFFGARLSL